LCEPLSPLTCIHLAGQFGPAECRRKNTTP